MISFEEQLADYRAHVLSTALLYGAVDANTVTRRVGICELCLTPRSSRLLLELDHDHLTGEIRAVVCRSCNVQLGRLDNGVVPDRLSDEWLTRACGVFGLTPRPLRVDLTEQILKRSKERRRMQEERATKLEEWIVFRGSKE